MFILLRFNKKYSILTLKINQIDINKIICYISYNNQRILLTRLTCLIFKIIRLINL